VSRRKTKVPAPPVPAIAVEERSREERWCEAGRRLHDLERFDRVLAIAEAYAASYREHDEAPLMAAARLAQIGTWSFAIKWRSN
jgi:hypothetical protein